VRVGVQMVFQSFGYGDTVTDAQVYAEEVELALLADALGFHALWPVEHHFFDYAFCPDNVAFLAYMAGRTERIRLGTGAVILPWNDPLRVAERIAMLDQLTGGRVLFGMGRGLARREYEGIGVSMDESRERFDEAAPMILDALESGVISGDGPHYGRAPTPIRPRPVDSFEGRTYCVAMSPDSVLAAADLGARMVAFSQRPWDDQVAVFETYRDRFVQQHQRDPYPPMMCDFVYCDTDPVRAEDVARAHLTGYLTSVVEHYELADDHFKTARGYESYGSAVDVIRALGLEQMCEMYLGVQAWGTPDQILEKLRARCESAGDFDLTCCFRFAGLPLADARRSMETFAAEVLPTAEKFAVPTTLRLG